MSRREEVEATWDHWGCMKTPNAVMVLALDQARTLADEVDELQRRLDRIVKLGSDGSNHSFGLIRMIAEGRDNG